jgi:hypothetical protein
MRQRNKETLTSSTDIPSNLGFVVASCLANMHQLLINLVPIFVAFMLQDHFALYPLQVNDG